MEYISADLALVLLTKSIAEVLGQLGQWDKKQGCQRTDRRQRCHGTGQAGTTVGDGSGDFALVKRQRLSEWLVFLNN